MTRETGGSFALLTGASQGLGKHMALELARRQFNTILVALPNEDIQSIAKQCRAFGVKAYYYETDLTKKEDLLALTHWINENFNISILINNAGLGGTESFHETDVDYVDHIIQLNIRATAMITHQLLPNMMQQKQAYILNVSSMAAFCPMAYKVIYSASKRFIQHFSLSLHQELKHSNVFVSIVHPGPMKTNNHVTQRIKQQGVLGKIGLLSPEKVARKSIHQLLKKKSFILLGWSNRLSWLFMRFVPTWIKFPILNRAFRRESKFQME
ncbi:SDR family oxidoreductase [Prolixibacter sp. SD074]|uniref:SDR family NAD(P)-dependent oxidoreductase n=1 Tax=Prolixibacter sp. SD074 TaxID=2652391 RepID=UPI001273B913|nr:SDR family NAD(P)-dependent oxidoreductase [Prolixibacter sp. SD074]GET28458.1 short-chain dehydrogenase [Prolixibacter sp. SD074]